MTGVALHPLHRLWRSLPQAPRRRLLHGGAAWLAPRPDRPAPPCRLGVAVAGETGRASGLGEGARLMLDGLRALGVPCWEAGPGHAMPPDGVPLVVHANPAALPLAMVRLGRPLLRGRRVVGMWPWELDVVPDAWRDGFGFVHEVWAPSEFSARAVRAAMPDGFMHRVVRVVPHPVACQPLAAPMDRAILGVPEGAVLTMVVFNLASSFARKNPLAAIEAHRMAFGSRPDRVLLLRVGNPAHFAQDFASLQAAAEGLPNVRFDTDTRSREDAKAALAAADIVLSLHRSEGFGLVPAEAILHGRPVVATAWSGTEDVLDDDCAIRIPARLVPAADPRGVFEAPGAHWAEADIAAAAAALVLLADDPSLRRQMGQAGRDRARMRLGPAPLAEALRGLGLDVPP